MDKLIKDTIEESWFDFQESTFGALDEEQSYKNGWEEGYEWILTELVINKEISAKTLEKYMNMLKTN